MIIFSVIARDILGFDDHIGYAKNLESELN